MSHKPKLGEILLTSGLISDSQLKSGLAYHNQWGIQLGESMVILGFITELDLLKILSKQLHIPAVQLAGRKITQDTLKLIKPEFAEKHTILPLGKKTENNKEFLFVATTDPTNVKLQDELRFLTNSQIKFVVATKTSIKKAIRKFYYDENVIFDDGIDFRIAKLKKMKESDFEFYTTEQRDPSSTLPEREGSLLNPAQEIIKSTGDERQCEDAQILLNLLIKKGIISRQEFLDEKARNKIDAQG